MARNRREHHNLEQILSYISSNYVKVKEGRIKSTNPLLKTVLQKITDAMKEVSPLFKAMFETYLYAGSSYDGLKVGEPNEFDIDFKLFLPKIVQVQILTSERDGFVHIYLKNWDTMRKNKHLNAKYGDLKEFMDDKYYLSEKKVRQWMESIVSRAIDKIEKSGGLQDITVSYETHGPAVTLKVKKDSKDISIDLVPVFRICGKEMWPAPPVRKNFSVKKRDYLVVPKPPKVLDNMPALKQNLERYWRLSFPQQEMELMNDLYFCKPALRFIKKLRDTQNHNIPSYYIKTVFLWEVYKRKTEFDNGFWRTSLSSVFLYMLKLYKHHLENHSILYFWNENYNFLELNTGDNISNISNYLERMINEVEREMDTNPIVVAKYLLPTKEYREVCNHFHVRYDL